MSISVTVRDGRPCVELPDHKGEVHPYAVELVASTFERLSVRLARLDDPDGRVYLVQRARRWQSCDCKDYQLRKRLVGEQCKHLALLHDPDFHWLLSLLSGTSGAVIPSSDKR